MALLRGALTLPRLAPGVVKELRFKNTHNYGPPLGVSRDLVFCWLYTPRTLSWSAVECTLEWVHSKNTPICTVYIAVFVLLRNIFRDRLFNS